MVKGRILVGHSIRNDLRALRLEEHPRELLRDTAKYPALMKVGCCWWWWSCLSNAAQWESVRVLGAAARHSIIRTPGS